MKARIYYCYSKQLSLFLRMNGLNYITKGIHPVSNRPYWTFVGGHNLENALDKWTKYKKTFYDK